MNVKSDRRIKAERLKLCLDAVLKLFVMIFTDIISLMVESAVRWGEVAFIWYAISILEAVMSIPLPVRF